MKGVKKAPHQNKTTNIFFLISNKILLKRKKSHPRTQGVYKGEQIKNENYKSQENPKEIKTTNIESLFDLVLPYTLYYLHHKCIKLLYNIKIQRI